jgi:branched-chain amino acid transport system ATP-binding protein
MRLAAEQLEVRRGGRVVLADVDLVADGGEVVGVVGANGAGKSTLLSVLAGLIRPAQGAIRLDGARVEGMSPQRMVRKGVCLVPQGRRVFPGLSVRRNLELGGWVSRSEGLSGRVDAFLDRHPVVARRADVAAGSLSGGEQGLVVLGRALMAQPRVLLLDEPLMGLDPTSAATVLDQLRELAAGETVLMVVDHDRAALATVATRTVVVDGGRVLEPSAG